MMPAGNTPGTPKQIVRSIQVLFYAIAAGLVFISAAMYAVGLVREPLIKEKDSVRVLFIAFLFAAAIFFTLAEKFYRKRIASALQPGLTLTEKLTIYRSALLTFLAAAEGIAFFVITLYFLTHNERFFAVVAIVLVGMFWKQPKKSRIFNELQLNSEEQLELN